MGRKRRTHKNLPRRVYLKNGAYRLLTPQGKWIRLGKTISEMYQSLSKLHIEPEKIITINQLIDRYIKEIAPEKAAATYKGNIQQSTYLKKFFGAMNPEDITPVDIYKYLDIRGQISKVAANREFALLSHILSYGIRWGVIRINPCTGVKKFSEESRNRDVTTEEFRAVLSIASYPVNMAMLLKYYLGCRPSEVRLITAENIKDDGVLVELAKTKKKGLRYKLVKWSPPLRNIINQLQEMHKHRRVTSQKYLLCNRQGQPYTQDGFSTHWQKTMKIALDKKLIKESFQFRDIRHKAAKDMKESQGLGAASEFLGHTNQNTTSKYIDGVVKVKGLDKDIIQDE